MPAINWTFLCDYAFVDRAGRASIIRTFTFIRAPKLPFRYPQLFLALEYMADRSESFMLGAVITAPSGKQIAKVQLNRKSKTSEKGRVEKGFLPLGFYRHESQVVLLPYFVGMDCYLSHSLLKVYLPL